MSQVPNYTVEDSDGLTFIAQLNALFSAVKTLNSEATEPADQSPWMMWADTSAGKLKVRNSANTDWLTALQAFGASAQGETFLQKTTQAEQRTALGLKSAATVDLTDNNDLSISPGNIPTRGNVAAALESVSTATLHVQHQAVGGGSGDYPGGGVWVDRPLNTVVKNTISGASLASNNITLPAGTYRVRARSPMFRVNNNASRIYDVTNAVTLVEGSATYSNDMCDSNSYVDGEFTLSGTATIAHQAAAGATRTGNAFGHSAGYGAYDIFGEVTIEKIG
ncbi:hypothetical protein [Thioclava sp.]|uniref:hypothetical protein n=1 Tax=Thioclava sp. TaxID=1933450 RepID=UPI003241F7C2